MESKILLKWLRFTNILVLITFSRAKWKYLSQYNTLSNWITKRHKCRVSHYMNWHCILKLCSVQIYLIKLWNENISNDITSVELRRKHTLMFREWQACNTTSNRSRSSIQTFQLPHSLPHSSACIKILKKRPHGKLERRANLDSIFPLRDTHNSFLRRGDVVSLLRMWHQAI